MEKPDLSNLITGFFVNHLAAERNVSPHTTAAYRDSMKLLLLFAAAFHKRKVCGLGIGHLTPGVVLAFLTNLEEARKNTVQTRNARLAAIHCFFRYVQEREPSLSAQCQRVLVIPLKQAPRQMLGYLSAEELEHLLGQVDRSAREGERDYLLLALLYDTGARIQELLDMKPSDCKLNAPSFVRVLGKGRKERLCPLLPQTARLVSRFLEAENLRPEDECPIFRNRRGEKLSRQGARYLFKKYIDRAAQTLPSLTRPGLSPHTLRHTRAMHLLQSGIPIVSIKDVLGHSDLKSTEVYVHTDLDAKRSALEVGGTPARTRRRSKGIAPDVLAWLESL